MNKMIITAIASLMLVSVSHANSAAGLEKSAACAACHGQNGISSNDMFPNLAGQKKGYLVKQMSAFKSGNRKDPMMSALSKSLSDQDISDIADYYSSLR